MVQGPISTFNPELDTITLTKGDTFNIVTTLIDINENPIDLTGSTIILVVKRNWADSSAIITITASIISAIDGDIEFSLTSTQTSLLNSGIYVYDIQLTKGSEVHTCNNPRAFVISEDIS